MECFKMLLCCAASLAAIAVCGQAAPQFGEFAFQNKRSLATPNVGLNGLASPFNDFGTPFDFGGGRTGFPAADFDDAAGGLIPQLPSSADLAGFTGFPSADFPSAGLPSAGFPSTGFPSAGSPSAGFPSAGFSSADFGTGFPQNQLLADGFAAPGLADFPALPADFGRSFSAPQVPAQPLQPPSESRRPHSDRQNSAAAEETTFASNPKVPATAYDNDGINTTPRPPSPGVPDLVLDLTPPPYSPQPNPSPQAGPENPGPAADDFDSVPNAALLPGRPFDYGAAPRPFAPASGSPGGRPVNAVASFGAGSPTANAAAAAVPDDNANRGQPDQAAASAPQTYATSVSTTPVGGGGSVYDHNAANSARPPPTPFAGNEANAPSAANDGRMPVVVVYGGGSNAHSASSYDDANAVRNSFDEIAGILTGIVKSVPGELVGDSNGSISANSKRESSSGDVRSPAFRYPDYDGGYKRD